MLPLALYGYWENPQKLQDSCLMESCESLFSPSVGERRKAWSSGWPWTDIQKGVVSNPGSATNAKCPWASHWISLCLGFPISENEEDDTSPSPRGTEDKLTCLGMLGYHRDLELPVLWATYVPVTSSGVMKASPVPLISAAPGLQYCPGQEDVWCQGFIDTLRVLTFPLA